MKPSIATFQKGNIYWICTQQYTYYNVLSLNRSAGTYGWYYCWYDGEQVH